MKRIIVEEWRGAFFVPHRLVFDAVEMSLFMEFSEYRGVYEEKWIRADEYCERNCLPLFTEK